MANTSAERGLTEIVVQQSAFGPERAPGSKLAVASLRQLDAKRQSWSDQVAVRATASSHSRFVNSAVERSDVSA